MWRLITLYYLKLLGKYNFIINSGSYLRAVFLTFLPLWPGIIFSCGYIIYGLCIIIFSIAWLLRVYHEKDVILLDTFSPFVISNWSTFTDLPVRPILYRKLDYIHLINDYYSILFSTRLVIKFISSPRLLIGFTAWLKKFPKLAVKNSFKSQKE